MSRQIFRPGPRWFRKVTCSRLSVTYPIVQNRSERFYIRGRDEQRVKVELRRLQALWNCPSSWVHRFELRTFSKVRSLCLFCFTLVILLPKDKGFNSLVGNATVYGTKNSCYETSPSFGCSEDGLRMGQEVTILTVEIRTSRSQPRPFSQLHELQETSVRQTSLD
jgi:hypothetical protein